MTVSTITGTAATAALLADGGITARGRALLDQARDMFVDNQQNYSMVEKMHMLNDLGDAAVNIGHERAWFTPEEKLAYQRIVEDSVATGPDGFIQQYQKFTNDWSNALQKVGPFPATGTVLTLARSYKEPWQQEFLKGQVVSLEVALAFSTALKSRDGQNGFVFTRDIRDGESFSVAHVKDPIARRMLELMRDYRIAQNVGTWREREKAHENVLAEMKQLGSKRADVVSLSKEAQAYLQALKRLADPDARDDTSEWRLKLLQPTPGTQA